MHPMYEYHIYSTHQKKKPKDANKHQNNDVCHIKNEEANKQSLLFYGSGIEN